MRETINFDSLPEGGGRYILEECVGEGVYGKVFQAADTQAGQKKVAIKIQNFNAENEAFIEEEYKILKEFCNHPNLPEFYGIYKNSEKGKEEIWFAMELCSGGPIVDLVNGLLAKNRRMAEEHIAFILKEVVKALIFLHDNKVIHRDIRGSNILLTKEGEVKLLDFGLSRLLKNTLEKTSSCLGSPSWMAPEIIYSQGNDETNSYDNRADVWSLGIVALELANGKSPYQDMHPTRAMFQIVRNPPPTIDRPANWSETFNDFINECLVKNPEHRPYMMELLEHPFLTEVPENNYYLTQELKIMLQRYSKIGEEKRAAESVVLANLLKKSRDKHSEKMQVEDLSALEELNEAVILQELKNRMASGQFCTFVGDVLLILNPNEQQDLYGEEQHHLYRFKSRSDNAPHIYSVVDSAYQAALHHEAPQHILLAGESASGKTTNYFHIVDHLLYLGQNSNINQERIKNGIKLLHAFMHASTSANDYSTRAVFNTEITFADTGKNTGAIFQIYQIEKWRVSSTDMDQPNFHMLYYFYDGIQATGELNKFHLTNNRQNYRYLRISPDSKSNCPRDNPKQNAKRYQKIQEIFQEFEFSTEQIDSVLNTLAAIINLGEVRFIKGEDGKAEVKNKPSAITVAQLLKVDEQKFVWALTNYCVINEQTATRRKHNCEEARDARDILANTLYCRVVQYVTSVINHKLSYGRVIFGDKYSVKVLDLYGFECFEENHFPQLLVNCTNEILQYHYLQRVFGWEALETTEENIPYEPIFYYNNKDALNEIMGNTGVLSLIDRASKEGKEETYVTEHLLSQDMKFINKIRGSEFSINHYTGKVAYDSKEMPVRNRDFLPPEIIEVLRHSRDSVIKLFFLNKINKFGNLLVQFEEPPTQTSDEENLNKYSQTRKMRTAATTFKAFSTELLKELSIGAGAGGAHFVRCVRSDLQGNSRGFHKEIVKQQLRAMSVLETAKARQKGFPHRIPFPEFLKRYKFLAFDFDENVDINRDNCRLLLVRLKMEGWVIGKTKVFLKYYNEEYLSRLYETQVKKIIKIQAMIRSYLAKRKLKKKLTVTQKENPVVRVDEQATAEQEEAAKVVQKAYRKYTNKKMYGKFSSETGKFDEELTEFMKVFYNKWRSKSIFQVLLQYRAAKYQDLYNLSQQVHLYNQNAMNVLQQCKCVNLERVDSRAQVDSWLGDKKPSVFKLPFRLDEIPYFDTSYMCEPGSLCEKEEETWDDPLAWRETVSSQITSSVLTSNENVATDELQNPLIELPYNRNPLEPVRCLSTIDSQEEKQDEPKTNSGSFDVDNSPNNCLEQQYVEPTQEKSIIDDNASSEVNGTATPANKDFEYIRHASSTKSQKRNADYVNPIVELEIKGRRQSVASDDEPPFNFQAMLRKTNFNRDSVKSIDEVSSRYCFKNAQNKTTDVKLCEEPNKNNIKTELKELETENLSNKQTVSNSIIFNQENTQEGDNKSLEEKNAKDNADISSEALAVSDTQVLTATEVVPGVFLEGVIVDL